MPKPIPPNQLRLFPPTNGQRMPLGELMGNPGSDKSTQVVRIVHLISGANINPLPGALLLQMLSYHMSVMRGLAPDFLRNLSKTLTID